MVMEDLSAVPAIKHMGVSWHTGSRIMTLPKPMGSCLWRIIYPQPIFWQAPVKPVIRKRAMEILKALEEKIERLKGFDDNTTDALTSDWDEDDFDAFFE